MKPRISATMLAEIAGVSEVTLRVTVKELVDMLEGLV